MTIVCGVCITHRMTPCSAQSLLQQSFVLLLYPCAVFFLSFLHIHYISYPNCPTFLQYGVSVQLHRLLPAFALFVTVPFHYQTRRCWRPPPPSYTICLHSPVSIVPNFAKS